jgi:argininosuccinate lyase
MKLWQKDKASLKEVEAFTVGKDRDFDLQLAPFDILGSIAHVTMLETVGLLKGEEKELLVKELQQIYHTTSAGNQANENTASFSIDEQSEDIHSQIEFLLTQKLGDIGKKIHSARSRNDQVLVDIKLYLRHELTELVGNIQSFFTLLQSQSEKYKDHLLPGYTHLQLAMPSSFGLWFGAYAESLVDDLQTIKAAYEVVNKNPLGSAAGYGSSFPINRQLTTGSLGFEEMNYNVVYAQMSRGKTERIVAQALANVADTLAKLSMDACLYLNQNFGFISFPAELTTGSSIMPHKKNPDVFELIRGHCNRIKSLPNEIMMITTNLPSGYHRDLQLLKEHLFPAFSTLNYCIDMAGLMLSQVEIKKDILADEKYKYLFTVDEVNKLVIQGIPFRDAYKIIGTRVEDGTFAAPAEMSKTTHEGSIGNLSNDKIRESFEKVLSSFPFEKVKKAINNLIEPHK